LASDEKKKHAFINSLLDPRTKANIDLKDEELRIYLQYVGSVPLLSRDEERVLISVAQHGDTKALQRIVEANLRFVVTIATKFQAQRFVLIDLIQQGNIGLIDAVHEFKLDNPNRFYTYAKFHAFKLIYEMVSQTDDLITTPYKVRQKIQNIQKAVEAFLDQGIEPTTLEIAERVGLNVEQVAELLVLMQEPISIEHSTSQADPLIKALPGTPIFLSNDLVASTSTLFGDVQAVMNEVLDDQERTVLTMRFGLGEDGIVHDYEDIGRAFGRTKGRVGERIRQIEKQAIQKIQDALQGLL